MADRFKKFTHRARRVIELAQHEARRLNHDYVGTEHLLLGLTAEGEGIAAKVLQNLHVGLEQVRIEVEAAIGRGNDEVCGELRFTPRTKKVIEYTVEEAKRLGHHYIGTEHLLLGLLREGEGAAAGVLGRLGVDLQRARDETLRILSSPWPPTREMMKRYNLVLPEGLYREVESLAERQNSTVVEVLRRFIKLGLLVNQVQEQPDGAVILREGERERHVVLL